MTTYADNTCGFLPLHAYEGAALDRAQHICAAINAFALEEFGLAVASPTDLFHLSLQDMLDAVRMVERWNARPVMLGEAGSCCLVPDDRLTAAVYTLLHFKARSTGADDDSIPVRFRETRWGDEAVHFLLVGARLADEIDEDDEDEAEAA